MSNLQPALLSNLLLLACSGCMVDWTLRDGGTELDDGSRPADGEVPDDGAVTPDADASDTDLDAGPDGQDVPDAPPAIPCNEGCGAHATCNEARQVCECDPNYYHDGTACVVDPCSPKPCGENEECGRLGEDYECHCSQGFTQCEGKCVDLQTNPAYCGACDNACAGTLTCSTGACEQPVRELSLGDTQTCALLNSASGGYPLKCWGGGADAFYRDGTATDSPVPRDVVGIATARVIALSDNYRCAVHPERDEIQCWGSCNVDCGRSSMDSTPAADLRVTQTDSVRSLAIAKGLFYGATCSLRSTGLLTCMGFAPLVPDVIDRNQWTFVDVGSEGASPRFTDVSGAYLVFCGSVADDTRRAACWGIDGGRNDLGAPAPATPMGVYVQREGGGDLVGVVSTSSGISFRCSLLQDGKVYCWGMNSYGMLGHGDDVQHTGAVEVMGVADATEVAVGGSHACARVKNGDLYCWGYIVGAGLGHAVGDMNEGSYFSTAQRLPSLRGVLEVRAGSGHTCARLRTGAVLCWGANSDGQVGDNSFISRNTPVSVRTLVRGLP